MTTTRILPAVLVAALGTVAPVAAQYGLPPYSPPGRTPSTAPSVIPGESNDGIYRQGRDPLPTTRGDTIPTATPDSLQQMTMPTPPGTASGDPMSTLQQAGTPGLPAGAYASPWYTDGPGCCGPIGNHGDVGYELYVHTGPTLAVGGSRFTNLLQTGWMVGIGGRTLFFNRPGDAAWLFDIGLDYQYNRGTLEPVGLFIRQNPITNPITGQRIDRADLFLPTRIRGLHRTAVNASIGRDWWLWGPGNAGFEQGRNLRIGAELGGRYGTCHVDLVPNSEENSYSRRQNVFAGMFLGGHIDIEVPIGGWIWFGGLRVQYGVDYTNVVPPIDGDVQYVNFLLSSGIRF